MVGNLPVKALQSISDSLRGYPKREYHTPHTYRGVHSVNVR